MFFRSPGSRLCKLRACTDEFGPHRLWRWAAGDSSHTHEIVEIQCLTQIRRGHPQPAPDRGRSQLLHLLNESLDSRFSAGRSHGDGYEVMCLSKAQLLPLHECIR